MTEENSKFGNNDVFEITKLVTKSILRNENITDKLISHKIYEYRVIFSYDHTMPDKLFIYDNNLE